MAIQNFGMVSQMDTESVVKNIMQAKQTSVDKLYRKRTLLQWRKEEYSKSYQQISDFRNKVFDYKLEKNRSPMKASVSDDKILTATASPEAGSVNSTIRVLQLAGSAALSSSARISAAGSNKFNLATHFQTANGLSTLPAQTEKFSLTINGEQIEVDPTKSMDDLVNDINTKMTAAGINVAASMGADGKFKLEGTDGTTFVVLKESSDRGKDFLSRTLKINPESMANVAQSSDNVILNGGSSTDTLRNLFTNAAGETSMMADTFEMKINGTTINVNTNRSMNELAAQINSANVGVKASYDANTDRIFFTTSTSGADAKIDFTGNAVGSAGHDFLNRVLHVDTSVVKSGTNAKYELNGVQLENSTNNFTVAGVSYSLKTADPSTTVTVSVTTDIDKQVENFKKFIDAYNEMMTSANKYTSEKRYRDANKKLLDPLIDAERKEMSESDIKMWDEKARQGMLYGDSILRSFMSNNRLTMMSQYNKDKYSTMSTLGVTTGANYLDGGLLTVNEDELKEALSADPQALDKLLMGTKDEFGKVKTKGILDKLYDGAKATMDELVTKGGATAGSEVTSSLGKELDTLNKMIDNRNTRLYKEEQRYYKQFAAMEVALQKIQQNTSWMNSM